MPAPLITLTTDFGLDDGYAGAMKGVILGILPWAQIVDISHAIAPQAILDAGYVLATAAPYFPRGTVHVVVVDPGVGTERRPLAVFTDRAVYIGPDNGVFSRVYGDENVQGIHQLANPAYRLPQISNTFHGRDLFAPAAAHIAAGIPPHSLGPEVDDPVRLAIPQPQRLADGSLLGEVIYVDRFGNLITNVPVAWLEGRAEWRFEIGGVGIDGFHNTYGRVEVNQAVVLGGSEGLIEVAVRNNHAGAVLGLGTGARFSAQSTLGNSKE
ncbi:MAG: SAM-dependent chlorinase/fluorinase [Caldilineales bacterium]|nr:SAM-dependent chlorinase/fluorinase [Caldilineales bacterium]MCW5858437.1 SAM-dependent chlorinase/fluorinase [Caldilineales bacterium]